MRLVRRHEEPPRHDDELEAFLQAARAVAHPSDLAVSLDTVLDSAMRLVGADEGSVLLLDHTTMTLSVVAARGLSEQARRQRIAVGQGIAGTVAVSGQPVLLSSAVDINRFRGYVAKDRPITAALCVPMRAHEQLVGVLSVNTSRPGGSFSERDLQLATIFAETSALAISNSRLLQDARRHAAELEMLRGATLRIGASLDLATVAQTTVQEVLTIAESDAAFIALSSRDGGPLELARYTGVTRETVRAVLGTPGFRRLGTSGEVRVIADVAADPVLQPLAKDLNGRPLALVPLRTADGRPAGLLGVAIANDAGAEIKRLLWTFATQAGLAISNALLHRSVDTHDQEMDTIVTTLDLPIILVDEDERFRAINPAAAMLFRISPEFELGHSARGKLHPDIEALLLDSEDDVRTEVAVGSGVQERVFTLRAATVGRAGGNARMLVLHDVSSARELERRKEDFVAVIGHELRTPLTNIKGFARTLAMRGESMDGRTRARAIETIVVQSERLERLIEDLLFVSRVEISRPPLHLSDEDLVEVCSEVVAEMSRRAPNRIVRFDIPSDAELAHTDRMKVEQILMHLMDNALKFSEPDTAVGVKLSGREHAVTISVSDHGRGIFSGDIPAIFEPFTQLDGTATRAAGGTGIGLYVAATMAEALGGVIDVESAIGKGSTFSLVIPRRSVQPDQGAPQS